MKTAIILVTGLVSLGCRATPELPSQIAAPTSEPKASALTIHKQLSPPATVTGRILWADGSGVQHCQVMLDMKLGPGEVTGSPVPETETDARGYYAAKLNTTGTYEISPEALKQRDRLYLFRDKQEVDVSSSKPVVVPDILVGALGKVVISWRKKRFKPLPSLTIASIEGAGEMEESFDIPDSGRYTVYASPGSYRISLINSETIDVAAGQTVNLDLGK
jgi:hypothetical protein